MRKRRPWENLKKIPQNQTTIKWHSRDSVVSVWFWRPVFLFSGTYKSLSWWCLTPYLDLISKEWRPGRWQQKREGEIQGRKNRGPGMAAPPHLAILPLVTLWSLKMGFGFLIWKMDILIFLGIVTGSKLKIYKCLSVQFSSVQSLSCVWLFATQWTAACQAS